MALARYFKAVQIIKTLQGLDNIYVLWLSAFFLISNKIINLK